MAETNNTIKTTAILDTTQTQQQIVKLNAVASDSTKTLEERTAAKNKQVELQNSLAKQNIANLEKTVASLKGVEGEEKNLEKAKIKLNNARIKATKLQENGAKQQNKLNQAYKDSKNPMQNLDKATGGLLGKMKLFLANPIGIVLTALVGIFTSVKKALNSTEDGQASFNAIAAAFGQILTNVVNILSDLVQPIFMWLANFLTKDLSGAFSAMGGYVDAVKLGFDALFNALSLGLTPLKAIVATSKAAYLSLKGDFSGAKQVMKDFKDETIETAKAIGTNLVDATKKVVETNGEVVDSLNKAGKSSDSLISKAAQIELRQNAFNKLKREQELLDAKLGVQSRQALADAKDLSLSDKERFEALKKFKSIEEQRGENVTKNLQTEIQLLKDRQALSGNTKEDNDKLNQLLIEQELNLEKVAKQQGKFNSLSTEFYNDKIANEKKIEANTISLNERNYNAQVALDELDIERKKKNGEDTLALELELLNKKREQELTNKDLTESEIALIEAKYKDEKNALENPEEEAKATPAELRKRDLEAQLELDALEIEQKAQHGQDVLDLELELLLRKRDQELSNLELTESEKAVIEAKYAKVASDMVNKSEVAKTISRKKATKEAIAAAGEAFGMQQEAAVATMIMEAPQAIAGSFKTAAETYPFPLSLAMGAAGAAGTVVPIIQGLADIKKARFPGRTSSSSSSSSSISTNSLTSTSSSPSIGSVSSISDISANNAARLGIDTNINSSAISDASNNLTGSSSGNVVFSEESYNEFQTQISFKEEKTTI